MNDRPVRPISPVAGYVGGKRQLAKTLVPMLQAHPHDLYAEPFVGMGGVFFRRTRKPQAEIINDLSKDVSTFFRILQRHYQPFLDMLRFTLTSRDEFRRLLDVPPDTLTDLERAARFLYLQRLTFGGKVSGRNFGVERSGPARFDTRRLEPLLEAAHDRLSGVVIECLGYADFIQRYDTPASLFFCDPPYFGTEHYYGQDLFARADFETLASALQKIAGAFILTVNDVPETRAIFGFAAMKAVEITYSVGSDNGSEARELIITNRPELLEVEAEQQEFSLFG